MTKNIQNPKEAICLVIFNKSQNVGYISQKLYAGGKRNSKISGWITELLEDKYNWIETDHEFWKRFEKGRKKDRREKYYKSTSKFILDIIESQIELKPVEKRKLTEIIASPAFGLYIESLTNNEQFKEQITTSSVITKTFAYFAAFTQIYTKYMCHCLNCKPSQFRKLLARPIDTKKGFPRNKIKNKMVDTFKVLAPSRMHNVAEINSIPYEKLLFEFLKTCDIKLLEKLSTLDVSETDKLLAVASLMVVAKDSIEYTLKLHDEK